MLSQLAEVTLRTPVLIRIFLCVVQHVESWWFELNAKVGSGIVILIICIVATVFYAKSLILNRSSPSSGVATNVTSTSIILGPYGTLGVIAGQTWSYGCPAQQTNQPCGAPYPNYPVAIYNAVTGQLVTRVTSDYSGRFSVSVHPGTYVVYTRVLGGASGTPGAFYGGPCAYPASFNPSWTGCASSPQYLSVTAGQTVNVIVNIPNGIY
jgi:hypothetical protein